MLLNIGADSSPIAGLYFERNSRESETFDGIVPIKILFKLHAFGETVENSGEAAKREKKDRAVRA